MRIIHRFVIGTGLFLGACGGDDGGGSGVDADKQIVDLTAAEVTAVCEVVTGAGPSEPVECGDGVTYRPQTQAECEASFGNFPDSCDATVGEVEACAGAIEDDACTAFSTTACAWVSACVGGQ